MERSLPTLTDADIRPALRSHLTVKHAGDTDTVILEEIGVCRGQIRIDLAVVNGLIHGYEIKSDRDSLRRLADQVIFYGRVVDRATIVVGTRHICEVVDIVPAWWEILHVESAPPGPCFETVRSGADNPGRDSRSLVEWLWLDYAIGLLEGRDAARGVRGKPRRVVWDRICEHFTVDEIAEAVRTHLKGRAKQRSLQPYS